MRLNKFLALHTQLSRRSADAAITEGRVTINGQIASTGTTVMAEDIVALDSRAITPDVKYRLIMLNKPAGYVCSRQGQGSQTVYDLLPAELHNLNPIGRLDKDSSGLLLLTNNGDLANELTHPRYQKTKIYEVELNESLEPLHQQMINDIGVQLDDGPSQLILEKLNDNAKIWRVSMQEGRNRQIRRTFSALGYTVEKLHRTHFGKYTLQDLSSGKYEEL